MSTRQLEALFQPESIVVVGASEHSNSLGGAVLRNLLEGGFRGELAVLNLSGYDAVHGVPCYARARQLPQRFDLAVLCTPAETIPRLVRSLGKQGVRAALIVMGGLGTLQSRSGRSLTESTLAAARSSGIRVLGPNSLGCIVPRLKLNASYSHLMPGDGEVAYVGESAMLGSAMLDWSADRDIGFSHFVTLGDSADVDIDDVVDYLASDWRTRAILLHVEKVKNARAFVSSISAAARGKLVLVLKTSQVLPNELYVHPAPPGLHSGDAVYDAVLHRVGALRVHASNELFDALRTLTLQRQTRGPALAVVSNGGGPAALAVDALRRTGGQLAEFAEETVNDLKTVIPAWGRAQNPVDLSVIASAEDYTRAIQILNRDPAVHGLLLLHVPTRRNDPAEIADAVIAASSKLDCSIMTSWIGGRAVAESRQRFDEADLPTYPTPDRAVTALMQLLRWQRNQTYLRETPGAAPQVDAEHRDTADQIIRKALRDKRDHLNTEEAFRLIAAYGTPIAEFRIVQDADEAIAWQATHGGAVALKLRHPDLDRPFRPLHGPASRWRAVVPDLTSEHGMRQAVEALAAWAERYYPDTPASGYMVQEMRRGLNSLQLTVGITRDQTFGPMIVVGGGGAKTHSQAWRRTGLPPLNMALARDLLRDSEIDTKLAESSSHPGTRLDALAGLLVRLSQLAIDQPNIVALEINPLLLNSAGLRALEVTVQLGEASQPAICPYPHHLVTTLVLKSGKTVTVRPIRAEDEPAHQQFHDELSAEALRFRYFHSRKRFTHRELAQMTQIDYDREMVFIASEELEGGSRTLGEMRAWIDPDNLRAEFSIVVRDEMRGEGLGRQLMQRMLEYCRERQTLEVVGTVLPENAPMLRLAEKLGFEQLMNAEQGVVEIRLQINSPKHEWQRQRLQKPVA